MWEDNTEAFSKEWRVITHLRLVELQRVGNFNTSRARQVAIEMELLLQFGQLFVSEIGASGIVGRTDAATAHIGRTNAQARRVAVATR